jgi:outer membrane protein TolC
MRNPSIQGLALIALVAVLAPFSNAQDLDSLTAIALRENPRLEALDAAYRGARAQIGPAGALPDPMLTYRFEGAPLGNPSPAQAMENRVELEQMLPFPGKQGLMKSMAAEEAAMAGAQLAQARLEVAADLHRAYYDLDLARASIAILEENVATLAAMAENARTRYEVGRGMQSDMLKARVEKAMEEARLAELRQRLPAALARVNAILNRAPGELLEIPLPDSLGPNESVPADSAALEEVALRAQPMVRMRARAVTRSEFGLRLARREGLPDFIVGAGYMGMKDAPDAWMGMLGVTLPIWRGNKVGPRREAAEEARRQALAELQQTRNDTRRMLREAWAMVGAARAMLRLYQDAVVPQAELSWSSSQTAYQTGALGFLDLLDAQRTQLQARLGYREALAEYRRNLVDLWLAAGDARRLGASAPDEGTSDE